MGRGRLCLSSAPFPPPPMLAPTSTSENGFIASFRSGSECYLWGHLDGLPGSCLVILPQPPQSGFIQGLGLDETGIPAPTPHTLQGRSSPRIRVDPSIISQPRALSSFSHSPPHQGTPRLRQSLACGQKSLHLGLLSTSTRGKAPQVQVFTRAGTVSNSYNLQSTGAHTHTVMNT